MYFEPPVLLERGYGGAVNGELSHPQTDTGDWQQGMIDCAYTGSCKRECIFRPQIYWGECYE